MKRCPKCNIEYFDATLEFCLEDGTRLASIPIDAAGASVVTQINNSRLTTEKTVQLPFSNPAGNLKAADAKPVREVPRTDLVKETVVRQSSSALEIAPFVIALTHNWWQWIYLNNQYYSSLSSYVLSANFLMWLLLLTAGVVIGLLAVKRCRHKGFVFAGLVILSINLILFLVPKR